MLFHKKSIKLTSSLEKKNSTDVLKRSNREAEEILQYILLIRRPPTKAMKPYILLARSELPIKKIQKALKPTYSWQSRIDEKQEAKILDTFDEELRKTGRILLQTEQAIILIDLKTGASREQRGKIELQCWPELPAGPVKEALETVSPLRAFLPRTEISLQLQAHTMLDDEGKTVARLGSTLLRRKKRRVQIAISQPLRGYDEAHQILVEALSSPVEEKEEDIYSLLQIASLAYEAKPTIPLQAETPIQETSNRIINTFIAVARRNEIGIRADYDSEFLHDYRVSLRKVRSVISLFKGVYSLADTAYLKTEFSEIMQATGRLRDLDVYLLDKDLYFKLVPKSTHEGLKILFAAFTRERKLLHSSLCKELQNKAYTRRMKSLQDGFANNSWIWGEKAQIPSALFAKKVIFSRYKKVCRIAASIDDSTADAIVHELRIHCKKLRYLLEFFTPVFSQGSVKSIIKSLKMLQDNLGRFNDYSVQQISLGTFLETADIKGRDGKKLAEGIGALRAMLNLCQQKERALVTKNFKNFNSPRTADLVSELFSTKG
ncbi:conserved hypothetical protein [Desulfotalea psychrophila LSv54]|uniref:CHAD domain-containing protein n=2 Tax=Desulfotalea psychrophila TaxID=84980 RepID=Q6ANU3_DESPS|nr:conserved hypothetical protein [Desulfotalea psychrophila LSv54]